MRPQAGGDDLKDEVRAYWNEVPCGTEHGRGKRYSRAWFDAIEAHRYRVEPEIHAFAQFTRWHGRRVLEVGIGAGTDFLQWVRAGAVATGVDLTPESIEHVEARLRVYGLAAEAVRVADAEALPFADDSFDLVYSWGVIHHTPRTEQALAEIVRVCRPGGTIKVMIYNRHSLVALYTWLQGALRRGRPWKSLAWALHHHMESVGTKAYTVAEARRMVEPLPVADVRVARWLTWYDRLGGASRLRRGAAALLAAMGGGNRVGWFLTLECRKAQPAGASASSNPATRAAMTDSE